jgi:hypothetical protein
MLQRTGKVSRSRREENGAKKTNIMAGMKRDGRIFLRRMLEGTSVITYPTKKTRRQICEWKRVSWRSSKGRRKATNLVLVADKS